MRRGRLTVRQGLRQTALPPADRLGRLVGMTGTAGPPPAHGVRLPWRALPEPVRDAIEQAVRMPIVAVAEQIGGFSPGVAARLELADGSFRFVKATGEELNPDSARIYRMEAEIAAALPERVPAPRLLDSLEVGSWIALLFEYVPGRPPRQPWVDGELRAVLRLLAELPGLLTPSPLPVPTAAELFGDSLTGWRRLLDDREAGRYQQLPFGDWVDHRLAELAELESDWEEAVAGDSLVHADLRADNLLLTDDRVWVVDWPWACRAQPWFDLLGMLPSIVMQGGPPAARIAAEHPVFVGADPAGVTATLAALIGYFLRQSMQPAPPNLPTLRAFQGAQGMAGLPWLIERTGWT
jgi:aminoglycoside phosphotransferase (APT) family kinase protein